MTRFVWSEADKKLSIVPDNSAPLTQTFRIEFFPGGESKTIDYSGKPLEVGF